MNAPPRRDNAAARAGATASDDTGSYTRPQHTPAANDDQDAPEHHNNRRRFLIWACMAGFVKPERVVERVVAEVAGETRGV